MGGVNFTRNRAWWHTAIWDEYGQRHQYLCFIPTLLVMMPMYYYGSFINRTLEQNWASKMYQLEYESKRLRLTHNLIMEHFETHVEKVQELMDDVKKQGFEKAFEYELTHPFTEQLPNILLPNVDEEFFAELYEHTGVAKMIDEIHEYKDIPYWKRQKLEKLFFRRKKQNAPYEHIDEVRTDNPHFISHVYLDPYDHDKYGRDVTELREGDR